MDIKIYRPKHGSLNGRKGEAILKGPEFEFCLDLSRELFIQKKAMVPYVQLSTNCRKGFWCNKKYF